jgi:hypothetical protein
VAALEIVRFKGLNFQQLYILFISHVHNFNNNEDLIKIMCSIQLLYIYIQINHLKFVDCMERLQAMSGVGGLM